MEKTVTIRLRSYLQEFYTAVSGSEKASTSLKSFLGSILVLFVEYAPKNYIPSFLRGPEYFEVELVNYQAKVGPDVRGNVYINEYHFQSIERCLLEHFDSIFYTFMDQYVGNHTIRKGKMARSLVNDGILFFCMQHKMNYAQHFECLKKKYYRERRNREKTRSEVQDNFHEQLPQNVQNYVQLVLDFQ